MNTGGITMKRIYHIVFTILALLVFAPAGWAQNYHDDGSGICYDKTISEPNTDGVYTITLESFVTGSVTVSSQKAPADIVLVLDLSTSMKASRGATTQLNTATPLSYNDVFNVRDKADNYLYGGAQLFAEKVEDNGQTRYYLYTNVDGSNNRNYLRIRQSNGQVGTNTNRNDNNVPYATSADAPIMTFPAGSLYQGSSRIFALKEAVCAFIDEINKNDLYKKDNNGNWTPRDSRLGNRLSIITFENNATLRQEFTTLTEDNVAQMKEAVWAYDLHTGTHPTTGLTMANTQFANNPHTGETIGVDYSRTAVVFTDGDPYDSPKYGAIGTASTTKKTYKATVFTVGMFSSTATEGSDLWKFMNYMSSNYPDATSIDAPGTGSDKGYFKDASSNDVDLSAIFKTIAEASGGSDMDLSQTTVSEVDVVSASFTLPDGADTESILVYTAPYNGKVNGLHTFGTETLKPNSTDTYDKYTKDDNGNKILVESDVDVDDEIVVTLKASDSSLPDRKDIIEVNGFDFGNNWCGYDEENAEYHGHKLVIKIPIVMNPTAVGGPNIATNADGSGIFAGDRRIVTFESPKVSLPVNIHINKQGLAKGESAKFTIQRTTTPDNANSWENVTSVFVTRKATDTEYTPITKVTGLPATDDSATPQPYYYRIVEEDWSWSYTPDKTSMLSTDIETNPFVFINSQKDNIDVKVRHAESKVSNIFLPTTDGGGKKFDDSKTNTRTN